MTEKYSIYASGRQRPVEVFCFSHLRWRFVYQRPQHLLTRAAKLAQVHFWEEPVFELDATPTLLISNDTSGVRVITPQLPHGLSHGEIVRAQKLLLDEYRAAQHAQQWVRWYYTPMALPISEQFEAACTVYDCMDELSGFQGAPPELTELEQRMFSLANVVFTGGASLYALRSGSEVVAGSRGPGSHRASSRRVLRCAG